MKACRYCAEAIQDAAIVCRHCGRDLNPVDSTNAASGAADDRVSPIATAPKRTPGILLLTLGGVLVVAVAAQFARGGIAGSTPVSQREMTQVIPLADTSALEISAGGMQSISWDASRFRSCRVSGRIIGLAGGLKDVDVSVVDEDGFINLQNHAQVKAYFDSGKEAAVTVDLSLAGGKKYYVVISNAFSVFTPKTVQIQHLDATCY